MFHDIDVRLCLFFSTTYFENLKILNVNDSTVCQCDIPTKNSVLTDSASKIMADIRGLEP